MDEAEIRYKNRESRSEDLELIGELRMQVDEQQAVVKRLLVLNFYIIALVNWVSFQVLGNLLSFRRFLWAQSPKVTCEQEHLSLGGKEVLSIGVDEQRNKLQQSVQCAAASRPY